MDIVLYLIIGIAFIYLGGRDPLKTLLQSRKEGRSLKQSAADIVPMFILPWPRTVNKRLIWICAGCFFVGSAILQVMTLL